jgi:hypothetical protein
MECRHYRGTYVLKALQGHQLSEGTKGAPILCRHYRGTDVLKALEQSAQPGLLPDAGNQPHVHRLVVQDFWDVTPYSLADGYQHF